MPQRLDSTLSNAWGVAINPAGIFWINVNGTDGSEIYDKTGVAKRPPVKVPAPTVLCLTPQPIL